MPKGLSSPVALRSVVKELRLTESERDDALEALGQVQRQLADSEALSKVGTWKLEIGASSVDWSDQTFRIHGYEPGSVEVTPEFIRSVIHEDDRDDLEERWLKAIEDCSSHSLIYRIRLPDGTVRLLHADNVLIEGAGDRPAIVYGAVHDISNLTEADSQKSRNANRISKPTQTPAASALIDTSGIVISASAAFTEQIARITKGTAFFGILKQGDSHDRFCEVLDSVEGDYLSRKIQVDLDTGSDNSSMWFKVEPSFFGEAFSGFSVSILPNQKRENAESIIEHQQLHSRFNSDGYVHIGAWETEVRSGNIYWTEGMYALLGISPEKGPHTRREFMKIIHPEDRAWMMKSMKKFDDEMLPADVTLRISHPSGEIRRIRIYAEYTHRDAQNSHIIGVITDADESHILRRDARRIAIKNESLTDELIRSNSQLLDASLKLSSIQEEERKRIAIELHDEAGGLMTAIQFSLAELDIPDAHVQLSKTQELLDQLNVRIRSTSRQLRWSIMDKFSFEESLTEVCEEMSSLGSFELKTHYRMPERELSRELRDTLFRVIRESLLNIVKHADATKASLSIHHSSDELHLSLSDDGVGFQLSLQSMKSTSFGLSSIRERIHSLGGRAKIVSEMGEGTTIHISLPLEERFFTTPVSQNVA